MPTAEAITEAVENYLKTVATGSAAAVAALYAEDATLEDPVGSEQHRGREAIERFYSVIEGNRLETELLTIRVAGDNAAFHFSVRTHQDGQVLDVEVIDVMSFDDKARITSMRAFWSEADIRLGG
jgi:steroid delta-isomerase